MLAAITQAPRKGYAPGCPGNGLKNGSSANARVEAGYYFGSLRNAQRALKNDHKLRRGWSKEKTLSLSFAGCIGPGTGWAMRAHDVMSSYNLCQLGVSA